MVSGFFLGGAAQGLDTAQQNDFRTKTLQLAQQRQQMVQEQADFARYDKIRADALSHIQDTIEKVKIANPNIQPQQLASNPSIQAWKSMLAETDKHLKTPGYSDSIITGFIATPSQAVTEGALARAKEGPQKQALVQSEIDKNKAVAQNLNPDLDRNTQLGGEQISPNAKAIGEYRAPPYTGYSARSPQARRIMDEVYANYPNYDAKNFKVEQAAAGAEVKADTSTLTKLTQMHEAVKSFSDTTLKNGDILLELAKKVDKTGSPVIDRWIRAGEAAIQGDVDVTAFNFQMTSVRADLARIVTQPNLTGQLTDTARRELESATVEGASYQQVLKFLQTARRDVNNRESSLVDAIDRVKQRLGTAGGRSSSGGGTKPPEVKDWSTYFGGGQ